MPERVLELLRRQEAVFCQLEGLSARQKQLVTGDDMGPLLDLLGERRQLSAELTAIMRELAPARRDWTSARGSLELSQRDVADRLMHHAGGRLRRLMESDEEDARKLSIRKQAVVQTLRSIGSAQHALGAYRGSAERSGRLDCLDGVP